MKPYRNCVVGVFINENGLVLVGKRSEQAEWQFPQGGVESGESEEVAVYREMEEEIGCKNFLILQKLDDKLSYDFPLTLSQPIAKKYKGQSQTWFLCKFEELFGPNLEKATDKEFIELIWVSPEKALQSVVHWKQEIYRIALQKFHLLCTT